MGGRKLNLKKSLSYSLHCISLFAFGPTRTSDLESPRTWYILFILPRLPIWARISSYPSLFRVTLCHFFGEAFGSYRIFSCMYASCPYHSWNYLFNVYILYRNWRQKLFLIHPSIPSNQHTVGNAGQWLIIFFEKLLMLSAQIKGILTRAGVPRKAFDWRG